MADERPINLRRGINFLTTEFPFFASLLFEMRLRQVTEPPNSRLSEEDIPFTMGTDGVNVFYSAKFVQSISPEVVGFALAHEVCHPMLLHHIRVYEHSLTTTGTGWIPKADHAGRGIMRHPTLWNMAGDYVINLILKEAGFRIWDRALLDTKYTKWTTEQVYDDLAKQQKQKQQSGKGNPSDNWKSSPLAGDLFAPAQNADMHEQADDWKDRVVRAAMVAKQRGKLPGAIEDLIKEYTEPVYPVYSILARFVEEACKGDDYSWRKPNQHMMNQGFILPGPYDERVPHVSVWYDTSGSVSNEELSKFHRACGDIIRNSRPSLLTLGQCDARVSSFQEIKFHDQWDTELKVTGRGGTSFIPPFDYIKENNIPTPTLLIYLTDLEGIFPEPPSFPVIWVSTEKGKSAPFGTTLHL